MSRAGAKSRKRNWTDQAIPVAIAALLPLACVLISHGRPFWTDELLTRVMVTDTSLSHMLAALRDTINAFPPLYFVLAWCWTRLFGASELSLRLLSSLPMAAGAYLAWQMLRRNYSRTAATLSTLLLLAACRDLFFQNTEARPYGLYFFAFAAASAAWFATASEAEPSRRVAAATLLSNMLLVATHYLGIVLSAALAAAALVAWAVTARRPWLTHALLIAASWAAFLPSLPFYALQSSLGTGSNWLTLARTPHLADAFRCGLWGLPMIAAVWACGMLLAAPDGTGRPTAASEHDTRATWPPMLIGVYVAAVFAVIPLLWLVSRIGPVVFTERYFFPLVLAWGVCAASACDALLAAAGSSKLATERDLLAARLPAWGAACSLAAWMLIAALAVREHLRADHRERRHEIERAKQCLAETRANLFVTSDPGIFLPMRYYEPSIPCGYLVPPDNVEESFSKARRASSLGLKRHYWPHDIRTAEELDSEVSRFAALAEEFDTWREWHVLEDWTVTERLEPSNTVIVERKVGS